MAHTPAALVGGFSAGWREALHLTVLDLDLLSVIPQWPVWTQEHESMLAWTTEEQQAYSNPEFGSDRRLLSRNDIVPTLLHSYGCALSACPCKCRAKGFSVASLRAKGLRGFGIISPATQAPRYLHPHEAALLCTLPAHRQHVNDCRAALCLIGQIAAPMQALWIIAQIQSWASDRMCTPSSHPDELLARFKLELLQQKHHSWMLPDMLAGGVLALCEDEDGDQRFEILCSGPTLVRDFIAAHEPFRPPGYKFALSYACRRLGPDDLLHFGTAIAYRVECIPKRQAKDAPLRPRACALPPATSCSAVSDGSCRPKLQVSHDACRGFRFGEASHPGPCAVDSCLPARSLNHCWFTGVRVGEASHPGSQVEANPLSALLGGLDIKAMLMPLLTQLIQKAIAEAFKANGVAAVDGLVKGNRRKRKRMKQKTRGRPGCLAGQSAQNMPGESSDSTVAQSSDNPSRNPTKGKGKGSTGSDAQPPRKGKGKGDSAQSQPAGPDTGKQQPEWTLVTRRAKEPEGDFQLRAQDWSAPLVSFQGLGKLIESTAATSTVQGVLLASKSEIETAAGMLKASGKPFSMLHIYLDKGPGTQRIPGKVGDMLRFRQAHVLQAHSDKAVAPPCPAGISAPCKVKQLQTALLYLRVPKAFASEATWKEFKNSAERASIKWASSNHVQGIDAFGWVEEQVKQGGGTQLFGLLRVPAADVSTLLGVSGQHGIFAEPAKREAYRMRVEWIPRLSSAETHAQYLQRALRGAPNLGLAVFGSRIAWRHPIVPGEVLPRIWCIDNLPSDWHAHEVDQLLAQGFKDVKIISHRLVRGYQRYRFRAVCLTGDKDLVPVNAATDDGSICLWATLAPTRAFETKQRKLARKAVPVLTHERTVLDPQPDRSKDSEVTETGEDGKTSPRAKHPRSSARVIPPGLTRVENPKDGNCAFSSIAQALQWLSKDGKKEYSHLELRTRVVAHLTKHKAEYEAEWDGIMPDGTKNTSFENYLAATAAAGAYASELELRALGRIYDTRILVLPADEAFRPMAFHTSHIKRLVVLWYQNRHLEFLRPEGASSTYKDYPKEFWQITDGPVKGLRAGGKPASATASSSVRSGTVFTKSGAGKSAVSVSKFTAKSPAASRKCVSRRTALSCVQSGTVRTAVPGTQDASHPARSVSAAAGSVSDNLDQLQCPARVIAKCPYRPALPVPRDLMFACDLCPFRQQASNTTNFRCLRHNHYRVHHHGQHLPGKFHGPVLLPIAKRIAFWRCPICKVGISKDTRALISKTVFARLRREHWSAMHQHEITRDAWKAQTDMPNFGPKCRKTHAASMRIRTLQRFAVQAIRQQVPGIDTFLWPRVRKRKDGTILRIMMEHAWKCRTCGACITSRQVMLQHSNGPCPRERRPAVTRARRLAALKQVIRWLRMHPGTPQQEMLIRAAFAAEQAITSQPSSSF